MASKGDIHRQYQVHGDGVETLHRGLSAIGMPEMRRRAALSWVNEVAAVNGAQVFRWYKTDGKDELCCWWDELAFNAMWVWTNHVHVKTGAVTLPDRPTDWVGDDGNVGWLLPGALAGNGGSPRESHVPTTICPVEFITQPVGSECPYCEVVHPPPSCLPILPREAMVDGRRQHTVPRAPGPAPERHE